MPEGWIRQTAVTMVCRNIPGGARFLGMRAPMLRRRGLTIAAASLALAGIGCSTTATIHRSNGPSLESRIVDGDPGALFVQSDNGLVYRVDRRTVADIDHPGNVHLIIGGLCLAASAALLSSSFTENERSDREGTRAAAAGYAVFGVPLALWGGFVYSRSRWSDEGRDPRPALVMAAPEELPVWPLPGQGWKSAPSTAAKVPAPATAAPTPPPSAPTPASLTDPAPAAPAPAASAPVAPTP
jgi:hypothetical protein